MRKITIIFLIAFAILISGCTQYLQNSSLSEIEDIVEKDAMMEKDSDESIEKEVMEDDSIMKDDSVIEDEVMEDSMEKEEVMENESMVVMPKVEYVPFTKEAYDRAKADDKTIFLEFYANWCPICKIQDPVLQESIPEIESSNLVAFRVNFNDSDTDNDEKEMARKFGVTYQHTHIITNSNEEILLKELTSWDKDTVKSKIGAFLSKGE